ncbi:MAG: hypothetical protein JSV52_08680 [Candidatus Zixiibacteriota bacterium]|nr:MAG: hypothetical protein JSV52_08680 [candidate division Zixibacteria bacterium]
MKVLRHLSLIMVIAMLVAAGCGKDNDTPTGPDDPGPSYKIEVSGGFIFRYDSSLWVECSVSNVEDTLPPELDSMTLAGTKLPLTIINSETFPEAYCNTNIIDTALTAGQEIEILAFTPYGTDTSMVMLFDYDERLINFLDWSNETPWDTIGTGTGIVLAWNPVDGADCYGLTAEYHYDSSGNRVLAVIDTLSNTAISISGWNTQFEGYWQFRVRAASGLTGLGVIDDFVGTGFIRGGLVSYTSIASIVIAVKDD